MLQRFLAILLILALVLSVCTGIAMAYGSWKSDTIGWWYQNSDGSYPAGQWMQINNAWYHFNADGYMQTGWIKDGSTWYYLKPSGAMATGWIKDGSTWYYLKSSGAMAADETINGYVFDSSGAWIEPKTEQYRLTLPNGVSGYVAVFENDSALLCLKNETNSDLAIDVSYSVSVDGMVSGFGGEENPCVPSGQWWYTQLSLYAPSQGGIWDIEIEQSQALQKYIDAYDSISYPITTDRYGTVKGTFSSEYVTSCEMYIAFFDSDGNIFAFDDASFGGQLSTGIYIEFDPPATEYDHYDISYNIRHADFD